jgi:hypothetical protein
LAEIITDMVVIVPKMVKQWLNGLWDGLQTVPQPKETKGLGLYASEPAFTRCKTGRMANGEAM